MPRRGRRARLEGVESRKAFLIKRYHSGEALNVGSGELYLDGAVNFDINQMKKPDIVGDFHNLPFKEGSFDVVFAFDIIEHTKTPDILVNEMERVGNNIVIECLDFDLCPTNWEADETHFFYMNKKTFGELLVPRGYHMFQFIRVYINGKHFRKNMLVGVKKQKFLDKQMFLLNSFYYAYRRVLEKILELKR